MADAPRQAFVCGHPIAHSRSPKIHRFWLERLGIDGSYDAIDVAPGDFANFLLSLRREGLAGGNVTIPHKEQAFALAERHDEAATAIGAVNTLWFEDGVLVGGNSDAFGFATNLDDHAPGWSRAGAALVFGAGGSARAVVHALRMRGIADIRIVNRTLEKAQALAAVFGAGVSGHGIEAASELSGDAGLVVNTTSLGMHGHGTPEVDLEALPAGAIVTDLVYVPLETPLLGAARHRGLKTVDGLGMLLHQAVVGFEKWFGVRPEVTPELRRLIAADLPA